MILKFDKIYSKEDLDKFTDMEEFTNYCNFVCLMIIDELNIEVDEYYLKRDLGLFNTIKSFFLDNGYDEADYKFYTLQA